MHSNQSQLLRDFVVRTLTNLGPIPRGVKPIENGTAYQGFVTIPGFGGRRVQCKILIKTEHGDHTLHKVVITDTTSGEEMGRYVNHEIPQLLRKLRNAFKDD